VRNTLEASGMTWFFAFKLRIAKIGMNMMRENPVRSLGINTMIDSGSPINDNIMNVMIDGNRLDYATGIDMLLGAPEMLPVFNVLME
jgi:hypothetical protein